MKGFSHTNFLLLVVSVMMSVITSAKADDTLTFDNSEFNQNKSLVIKLPESYHSSAERHYPVIYHLNAKAFYFGNLTEHTEQTITRLTAQRRIPESIVVHINSESWYTDAIVQHDDLASFLINEVVPTVSNKYRVLAQHILIGHSYTGAFMAATSTKLANVFNHQLIISPIFPDVDFIKKTASERFPKTNGQQSVQLFVDPQNMLDVTLLKGMLAASNGTNWFDVNIEHNTGHFTVLPIAISKGFAKIYADFLMTKEKETALSYEQLRTKYIAVQHKYQQPNAAQNIDSLVTGVASNYLEQGYFSQAFALWHHSTSKFKHYFINRAAQRFFAQKDYLSAQRVWQGLTELFPNSPFAWQYLMTLAETINNDIEKQKAQKGFSQAKISFTQDDHAMWLAYIQKDSVQDMSLKKAVLNKILHQDPSNEQAQLLKQQLNL